MLDEGAGDGAGIEAYANKHQRGTSNLVERPSKN